MKSPSEFLSCIHEAITIGFEIARIEATQTSEIHEIKTKHKAEIDGARKKLTSIKGRVTRWIKKSENAVKMFDGKETGTHETNLATIVHRNNPAKIVPLDKEVTKAAQVEIIIASGQTDLIRTTQEPNLEAMEALTDDELIKIGFKRTKSTTLSFSPKANPKAKNTSKTAA